MSPIKTLFHIKNIMRELIKHILVREGKENISFRRRKRGRRKCVFREDSLLNTSKITNI